MSYKLKGETEEGVGEVRALLSHADVHAGIGAVEGADQETSIRVYDAIIQPDLRDRQKHVRFITKKNNGCLHFFFFCVSLQNNESIRMTPASYLPSCLRTYIFTLGLYPRCIEHGNDP